MLTFRDPARRDPVAPTDHHPTEPRPDRAPAIDNVRPLRRGVVPPAPAAPAVARRRGSRRTLDARALEHARTAAPWGAGDPLTLLARIR